VIRIMFTRPLEFKIAPRQPGLRGTRMRTMGPSRKTISKLRSALATALVVWCAGAGCMIVSYARGAAMSAAAVNTESRGAGLGQVSGSAGAHDCCKARHASQRRVASSTNHASFPDFTGLEELAGVPPSSDAMNCCPLTSGTFVVSGSQSISNENVSAVQGAGAGPIVSSAAVDFPAMPLRLPNQNETYLRGCVFLI
jgi:hypothetical protein